LIEERKRKAHKIRCPGGGTDGPGIEGEVCERYLNHARVRGRVLLKKATELRKGRGAVAAQNFIKPFRTRGKIGVDAKKMCLRMGFRNSGTQSAWSNRWCQEKVTIPYLQREHTERSTS